MREETVLASASDKVYYH